MKGTTEQLRNLYYACVAYMNDEGYRSAYSIIEEAQKLLTDINELDDIHTKCIFHTNWWDDERGCLKLHCDEAEQLVEELCGCLAEYLGE